MPIPVNEEEVNPPPRDPFEDRSTSLREWRLRCLVVECGLSEKDAGAFLDKLGTADTWHAVKSLLDRGCSVELAKRILL